MEKKYAQVFRLPQIVVKFEIPSLLSYHPFSPSLLKNRELEMILVVDEQSSRAFMETLRH